MTDPAMNAPTMNASTILPSLGESRPSGTVVPFAAGAPRRFRREPIAGSEPRGQILFFTGVRYERLTDAPPALLPKRKRL